MCWLLSVDLLWGVILANLTSGDVAKKPMISKKFLLAVLGLAVVAFSAVLGSIFLKEFLDQSAASKSANPTGTVNGPRPGMPGLSSDTSTPADKPVEEEPAEEEKPAAEAEAEEVQVGEKP